MTIIMSVKFIKVADVHLFYFGERNFDNYNIHVETKISVPPSEH